MRSIVVIVMFTSGCLKTFGPDIGPEQHAGDSGIANCEERDSDPKKTVSFSKDIYDGIFVRYKCRMCHTGGGEGKAQSGLDLADYQTLRRGGGRSLSNIIIPGSACASILYQKVTPAPPFGRRMPRDSTTFLTDDDMALLADWIHEGAHEN